ncbi:MAG: hypothetical protein HN352_18680, partial [Bacteroidetes bacterium]|nr:hypothetical protein [Bacteroidota bacterium]
MMATLVIVLICGVILLLYIFRISAYSFAIWKYTRQTKTKDLVEEIKVTLLIPFRNEEKNLPNIILDTQIQLYPSTYSEV